MARYSDTVRDQNQVPVVGALVAVTLQDGTEPEMKDDEGNILTNPLTTDGYGNFSFNLVGSNTVDLKIYYGGRLVTEEFGVLVGGGAPPLPSPPAGLNGQVQYNNAGTMGGATGIVVAGGAVTSIDVEQGGLATAQTNLTQAGTWNDTLPGGAGDGTTVYTGTSADYTFTSASVSSRPFEYKLSGQRVCYLNSYGEFIIASPGAPSAPKGGIRIYGNGTMALTQGPDPSSGECAPVLYYFWEDQAHIGPGDPFSVTTIQGQGGNRFSIESIVSGINFITATGRFEYEGLGSRLLFIGYEKASAIGKTFDFNNFGQSPSRANPVVSISSQTSAEDILHLSRFNGSTWTALSRFNGNGWLFAPVVSQTSDVCGAPGTSHTGDTAEFTLATIPLAAGCLGATGQFELDALLSFSGTAAVKTVRVYLGPTFGAATVLSTFTVASAAVTQQIYARVANKTASSQISLTGSANGYTASTSAPATSSINTAIAQNIYVTVQNTSAADTSTLESFLMKPTYGA